MFVLLRSRLNILWLYYYYIFFPVHIFCQLIYIIFQLLERALQECGNDLDAAIKSLRELCLGSDNGVSGTAEELDANVETGINVVSASNVFRIKNRHSYMTSK